MAFNVSYVFQAIDKFSEVASKVQSSMAKIKATTSEMTSKMNENAEKVSSLGKKLSLGVTAPLLAMGGISLNAAASQEKLNAQMLTLIGNAEKAKTLGNQLEQIKMNAPIDVSTIDDAALRLLVMGTSVDKVSGVLESFAKISHGTGESLDNLVEMFAIAQSGPEGMSRALMQLNRKIPVIAELQKILKEQTGKDFTSKEVRELAAAGKITADSLQTAFSRMTAAGGKFATDFGGKSQTLKGALQVLTNNFGRLQESVGFAVMNSVDLTGTVDKVSAAMKSLVGYVEEFAASNPKLTEMIVIIAGIAAATGPMLIGLGSAINAIAGVGKAIIFLASPMGLIIGGILAAVAALGYLYNKFEIIRTIIDTVISTIGNLLSAFPMLTIAIVGVSGVLLAAGKGIWIAQGAMMALKGAGIALTAMMQALPIVISLTRAAMIGLNLAFTANPIGIIIAAVSALVVGIGYLLDKFGLLDGILAFIKEKALAVADAFKTIFSFDLSGVTNAISSSFTNMKDKLSGFFSSTTPVNMPPLPPLPNSIPNQSGLISDSSLGAQTIRNESQSTVDINLKGNTAAIDSVKSKTDGKTNLAVSQNMAYGAY